MGNHPAGYSMLELLVGLALTATLTALSTPSFLELRSASQSRESLRAFQTLMQLARHTAVSHQSPVTVCVVDEDRRCRRQWRGALQALAFIDSDGNREWGEGETLVQQQTLGGGALRWRASLGRHYLVFRPSGQTRENGSLYYCPPNGNARRAWTLVVNRVGRVYTTRDGDGDGVREDSRGQKLQCPP